jgi:hypothetical protein
MDNIKQISTVEEGFAIFIGILVAIIVISLGIGASSEVRGILGSVKAILIESLNYHTMWLAFSCNLLTSLTCSFSGNLERFLFHLY